MSSSALLRAHRVMRDVGLGSNAQLERVDSALNEVWLAGPFVLRISASLGTRRLEHEVHVARMLPPEVRYPEIVTYGRREWMEWLVLRRRHGQVLSRAWPTMRPEARKEAVTQLAATLRQLHKVRPTEPLSPPFLEGDSLECPHQLPVERVLELLERARDLRFVERRILDKAARIALDCASALDDPSPHGLIHGDLHFENVLWDGNQISALVDFEWARPAPADLELDVLLRFCADPSLHVAREYEHLARQADYSRVPAWLRQGYPDLFAHPRLIERLTVYGLSYDVRHLLCSPPTRPADSMPPHSPYNRIVRLVQGRTHLHWMDW